MSTDDEPDGRAAIDPPGSDALRFAALWDRHAGRVQAYALRHVDRDTAQEVVSETFLVAWRRLADVPGEPLPWLLVVARNTIANHRRSHHRARLLAQEVARLELVVPRPSDATDGLVSERDALLRVLARLTSREREALLLVAWDGLTTEEAAVVAGCSPTAFKVRLHRARRRLDAALGVPDEPAVAGRSTPPRDRDRVRHDHEGLTMTDTDLLTRHAPATPVDPAGLDDARRATFARLDEPWAPPRRRLARPAMGWGLAAASAAALTVVGLTLPSPTDRAAFGGWSAEPRAVDAATLATNGADCARLGNEPTVVGHTVVEHESPTDSGGPLQPVLSEERGPNAFTVVASDEWVKFCLVGPALQFSSAHARHGGGGFESGGPQPGGWSSMSSNEGYPDPPAGGLTLAERGTYRSGADGSWSAVLGRAAPDVRSVQVRLVDGSTVEATVTDGFFVAWWPGAVEPREVTGARDGGGTARESFDGEWSWSPPPAP